MSTNRLSSHKIILNFCAKLRVDYDFMYKGIKPLLQQYSAGRGQQQNIKELMTVEGEKNGMRRRFITIIRKPDKYTELDRALFAYAAACSSWYPEKSDKLLQQMEVMVPDGKEMALILKMVYLDDEALTDSNMQRKLHLSIGSYNRRKKDALVLYGALLLEYSLRRVKEEIAKGTITPPDFEL